MSSLRILLADDHEMIRKGLRATIESQPGWTVCGEARTGREAVALARELRPDIVVMDFAMPELNGLEATRQIRAAHPGTEVLILTMHCLLYTSDAADDLPCVNLGRRRIIKKKKQQTPTIT